MTSSRRQFISVILGTSAAPPSDRDYSCTFLSFTRLVEQALKYWLTWADRLHQCEDISDQGLTLYMRKLQQVTPATGRLPARPQRQRRGRCPTGRCPTGRCPTGRCPTGRCPTGPCPTGPCPTGRCPTGRCPTGRCPTGRCPTGPCPTGPCPTGRCPTACCPTGRCPTGRCPTGSCPTGSCWLDTFSWWTILCPELTLRCPAALLCLIHSHQPNTHYHTTTTHGQMDGAGRGDRRERWVASARAVGTNSLTEAPVNNYVRIERRPDTKAYCWRSTESLSGHLSNKKPWSSRRLLFLLAAGLSAAEEDPALWIRTQMAFGLPSLDLSGLSRAVAAAMPTHSNGHRQPKGLHPDDRPEGDQTSLWTPLPCLCPTQTAILDTSAPQQIAPHAVLNTLSLTPRHSHQRLQWCHARLAWSDSERQRVIFSDESRFVETPNESVCGGTVVSTKMNGVLSLIQKAWCHSTSTPTAPSAGTVADVNDWLKGGTEHVGVAKDHSVKEVAESAGVWKRTVIRVYQQWENPSLQGILLGTGPGKASTKSCPVHAEPSPSCYWCYMPLGTFQSHGTRLLSGEFGEHLGLSREHLGLSPEQLGLSPEQLGLSPEQLGLSPEQLGLSPEQFSLNTEQLSLNREQLGLNCEQLSFNTEQLGLSPEQLGLNPEQLGLSPEQLGLNCEQLSFNTEQLGLSPEQLGLSPEQLGLNPEQLGLNPEQLGLNPEQLGLSPEQLGLNPEQLGLNPEQLVPADGAVGVEVEGHQAFETCDNKPFILVLTTVPPHTDSLGVSTKTKAGLVTEDDPLPF
ncbi:hypothetical protein NFI96_004849 [Prochilodus magdalenae]|nr:hypothetical protein NFI96_004849 [Prochilodus magdalenae]